MTIYSLATPDKERISAQACSTIKVYLYERESLLACNLSPVCLSLLPPPLADLLDGDMVTTSAIEAVPFPAAAVSSSGPREVLGLSGSFDREEPPLLSSSVARSRTEIIHEQFPR